MRKPTRNKGASVRARLLNLAKERNQPFNLLLTGYVLERFLYRLGQSKYRNRFILKGAMLMTAWFNNPLRPTRDIDLLGTGKPDSEAILKAIRDVATIRSDDAVTFDLDGFSAESIREETEYRGIRIKTDVTVDKARVRLTIDVGFGDATEPGIEEVNLPVLLDAPSPHLRAYARETVIAEKFQAMVMLGRANTRMKDFYDIWLLSQNYEFKDDRLARAIAATFKRRKTAIPTETPDALRSAFAKDPVKEQQWKDFIEVLEAKIGSLTRITSDLEKFLMPHARQAEKYKGAKES